MRNFHKPQKRYYTINYQIQTPQLRVIDKEGKQIGILKKDEALKVAKEAEEDLILIAPNANPPVAKIMDFRKFLYQEGKKQKEAKKGIKKGIVKDIKLSLFIGPADLERMIKKAEDFLNEGNQVRINITMRGRELGKKDLGIELANKVIKSLGELNIAKEPRIEGRVIRAVVSRKK